MGAADGKKMSKRLQNYPKPDLIVKKFGADALRLYLINSPVVRAEPLKFMESGVKDVIKDIFIPWFNSYRFFITQARRLEKREGKKIIFDKISTNIQPMLWINGFYHRSNHLLKM